MNEKNDTYTVTSDKTEVISLKPWHKPHVNVYKMSDAEAGPGGGDTDDSGLAGS